MSFPTIKPTRRTASMGDYPVKAYRAISGAETRIRYGNLRSEATLELGYEGLSAAEAAEFANHYEAVNGTTYTFAVTTALTVGWNSGATVQGSGKWRYDGPPTFSQVGGDCDRVDVAITLKTVVG